MEWIRKHSRIHNLKGSGEKPPPLHRFNLIPTSDSLFVDDIEAEDWQIRMICMTVADGRTDEYERLYRDVSVPDFYQMYTLRLAHDWKPPAKKKRGRG